jgi:hypothetical protein
MALTDQTRAQLRARLMDVFLDGVQLTFTANGSTTTCLDTFNVNTGSESFDGRDIIFTNSTNIGLVSRITGTNATTGTLTFAPARTSTLSTETADVVNRRGKGFTAGEYHRAINSAIEEINGLTLVPVISSISDAYSVSTQTFTVPTTVKEIYLVEYQDGNDDWREIPPAGSRGGIGWTAEPSAGVIRIKGNVAEMADGYSLRTHGYAEQAALTSETSVCAFDGAGVVAMAAYTLCRGALDRDQRFGTMLLTLKDDYEKAKARMWWLRDPQSVIVRL